MATDRSLHLYIDGKDWGVVTYDKPFFFYSL